MDRARSQRDHLDAGKLSGAISRLLASANHSIEVADLLSPIDHPASHTALRNARRPRARGEKHLGAIEMPDLMMPVNLVDIFEFMPGVCFYLKDRDCRWRACNSAAATSLSIGSIESVIGKNEYDFFPLAIAEAIQRDDHYVVETGNSIVNKLEVVVDANGQLIWVTTTKLPALDAAGNICGLIGLTRVIHKAEVLPERYRQFSKVMRFIEENYHRTITAGELARLSCLSESQFRKRFHKLFQASPQQFILRVRMQAAAHLLATTDEPIVSIALRSSFCDQSYFTRLFSGFFGITPKKYRQRWR
jgi:AraC-like DNA-binding protein